MPIDELTYCSWSDENLNGDTIHYESPCIEELTDKVNEIIKFLNTKAYHKE